MPFEKAKASFPMVPHAWHRSCIVLGVIFSTEYALMLALPLLLPQATPSYLEAAVDALLLSLVAMPVLWLTMVFPLKQAARQRDLFLSNMFVAIEDEREDSAMAESERECMRSVQYSRSFTGRLLFRMAWKACVFNQMYRIRCSGNSHFRTEWRAKCHCSTTCIRVGANSLGRLDHNRDGSLADRASLEDGVSNPAKPQPVNSNPAVAVPESLTSPQGTSGELLVWSTSTGLISQRLPAHKSGIHLVKIHPKLVQLITVDGESEVRLWDVEQRTVIRRWSPKLGAVEDVVFAPDGLSLVIVGEIPPTPQTVTNESASAVVPSGFVTWWNPETVWQTLAVNGLIGKVARAEFSPDGTQLWTASHDGTVRS